MEEAKDKKVDGAPFYPEADFAFFISSLGMQAMMALGEIPNPSTGQKETDVRQAQYLIDILHMLSAKSKGNLNEFEAGTLQNLLYELQLKFVDKSRKT